MLEPDLESWGSSMERRRHFKQKEQCVQKLKIKFVLGSVQFITSNAHAK